jgi:hypothetical protein
MRGYDQCRSHLDHTLGPRGAGAPRGNLNAVKTGQYANPMSYSMLRDLGTEIARNPDSFRATFAAHVDDLYRRVAFGPPAARAYRTLLILQETMEQLVPHVANALFIEEIELLAEDCPPQNRNLYKHDLWSLLAPLSPHERLLAILNHKRSLRVGSGARKQLAEHSTPVSATSEEN